MGFKDNNSFLRYVTMGASGVRRTIEILRDHGFAPIELERYATSNKIWATKIKRLRLPDLLCVRTGLRVEVKTKSAMAVKMSDAPSNPARAWDAGLRSEDLIAFIGATEFLEAPRIAAFANFFTVGALQDAVVQSRLGPPKSAGEGSERDREWPTYVPSSDGEVIAIDSSGTPREPMTIRMRMTTSGAPRSQSYSLNGKAPYVRVGDKFVGYASIIAGVLPSMADLGAYSERSYDPLSHLTDENDVDRYAAVKALPHRSDLISDHKRLIDVVEQHLIIEPDQRVAIEAAGSAAALGSLRGKESLRNAASAHVDLALRMESIFILSELSFDDTSRNFATDTLTELASNREQPSELRQAAVWGLGFRGQRRFDRLLGFLDDDDDGVAVHAIAAFGAETQVEDIRKLVARLDERNARMAASASESLLVVGTASVIAELLKAIAVDSTRIWALATLGRFDPARVRAFETDRATLEALAPMFRAFSRENWLTLDTLPASIQSLRMQRL